MGVMAPRKVSRSEPGRHPNQDPRPTPGPSAPAPWLVITDATALILFVLMGMRSHHEGTLIGIFLRNAIPLLGAWFVVAAFFGTYRKPGLVIVMRTWIVAVPIGLVVRSLWVGSPQGGRIVVFLAVGLVFTALFLLAARGVVAVVTGHGYPQRRRRGGPSA
jgi:Protein of unknown function (DUF3054)